MKNTANYIASLFFMLLLVFWGCGHDSGIKSVHMTHETTEAILFNTDKRQLALQIKSANQIVLDTSLLGIVVNGKKLGVGSKIRKEKTESVNLTYAVYGIKNKVQYQAQQFSYELEEADGFKWQLQLQLSREGVAYRYKVPGDGKQHVTAELSTFRLPQNTKVWYFERDSDWKLKSHAGEWRSADIAAMPTISKMGPVQGLTLTCELPNGSYALLAEAALYNYSGLRLEAIGDNSFRANFTEGETGFEIDGEVLSPWRCVLLADNLNELVNNTMVASLNPAPDETLFSDTTWIKPGKSAWHWWSGKYVDFDEEMAMVDDAAALGFEYNMVDDGWKEWEDKWQKLATLSSYAQKKAVGIFVWKHSDELNFPENDYAVIGHYLDSVKQAGAVGIKVDFMNGQTKALIDFDEALLRKAAERRLMVNFHGCQQSSGEYRTYPNEVTREGIRGLEVNHMKEGPLPASHNAALPFTRFVTGHGDYTPIGFTEPGETTWAHQLGTLVAFYSPFNCIAENTQFLLTHNKVKPALGFMREVPVVWDETMVLPKSKIGELALIARRKGDDWYIGVLSSGDQKEVIIDCSFLKDGEYTTSLFLDDMEAGPIDLNGLNKEANLRKWNTAVPFKMETQMATASHKISIKIAPNGGAAIQFKKK